jgi:hypothetical protein
MEIQDALSLHHSICIAEGVADVLVRLHDQNIVVYNLQPAAIVWDAEELKATLLDFESYFAKEALFSEQTRRFCRTGSPSRCYS